jgi:hypothetical protein
MIRSRLGLKALGLSAMLLGLMAFTASGAQAEATAAWMVNGTNVNATLLPSIDISEIETGKASLLTKIAGATVTYTCTGAKLVGAKLEPEGKLTNGGKVLFTGCETFVNGALSAVCVPKSSGKANGEIESLAGKGLIELNAAKEPVTKISPSSGETFATILHGGECGLPESVPVKGKLVIKDCKKEGKVELVSHLIEQDTTLSHLFVISDTAEHAAIIDGSALTALTGAHAGLKFSGLPG